MIYIVKGFSVVNKAEVFLECSCFLHDATNVGNLIFHSSASFKPSLYIWKFSVPVLLKPSLKDFEHNLTSMWNEHSCVAVGTFFGIAFLWDWNKKWLFQSCGHCWAFQICWHIEYSTFRASSFRILNSSARILSFLLALFVVILLKSYLTSQLRMFGSRLVTTPSWLSGSLRLFLYNSVYSCHLFLISSASVGSLPCLFFITPILAWNVPLISPIFLKRSLLFPNLLFSSISLHCSFKKAFVFPLAVLWNSALSTLAFCFSSFLSYL